jgi:hypothetical protein
MIRFYVGYGKTAKFRTYEQEFNCAQLKSFRLLIITTSQVRLDNMRQSASGNLSSALLKFF